MLFQGIFCFDRVSSKSSITIYSMNSFGNTEQSSVNLYMTKLLTPQLNQYFFNYNLKCSYLMVFTF